MSATRDAAPHAAPDVTSAATADRRNVFAYPLGPGNLENNFQHAGGEAIFSLPNGLQGYFIMNDSWFDEYTFEIAARKEYLPADLQAALDLDPIVLPAWDPMGALAR